LTYTPPFFGPTPFPLYLELPLLAYPFHLPTCFSVFFFPLCIRSMGFPARHWGLTALLNKNGCFCLPGISFPTMRLSSPSYDPLSFPSPGFVIIFFRFNMFESCSSTRIVFSLFPQSSALTFFFFFLPLLPLAGGLNSGESEPPPLLLLPCFFFHASVHPFLQRVTQPDSYKGVFLFFLSSALTLPVSPLTPSFFSPPPRSVRRLMIRGFLPWSVGSLVREIPFSFFRPASFSFPLLLLCFFVFFFFFCSSLFLFFPKDRRAAPCSDSKIPNARRFAPETPSRLLRNSPCGTQSYFFYQAGLLISFSL